VGRETNPPVSPPEAIATGAKRGSPSLDRLDVVKTTSVKKVGVGFAIPAGESAAPSGMELVTGDTNIVNVALVLQYVIRDPAEFLFSDRGSTGLR
jgi:hypothetical protein